MVEIHTFLMSLLKQFDKRPHAVWWMCESNHPSPCMCTELIISPSLFPSLCVSFSSPESANVVSQQTYQTGQCFSGLGKALKRGIRAKLWEGRKAERAGTFAHRVQPQWERRARAIGAGRGLTAVQVDPSCLKRKTEATLFGCSAGLSSRFSAIIVVCCVDCASLCLGLIEWMLCFPSSGLLNHHCPVLLLLCWNIW